MSFLLSMNANFHSKYQLALNQTPVGSPVGSSTTTQSSSPMAEIQESTSSNESSAEQEASKEKESIVVFGATGLVGSRIVKALSKIAQPHQSIYILSRDIFMHDRPQVIPIYSEPGAWVAQLKSIPNITTVYCALGAAGKDFYQVNHNLFYQIAIAAREINVPTFVMISGYDAGYILPKVFYRNTIIRAASERDIRNLKFEHLIILRPGPLVGVREKRGSLKKFQLRTGVRDILTIFETPLSFLNPATPFLTFNFGTSAGKAAVHAAMIDQVHQLERVTVIGHLRVMQRAALFNKKVYAEAYDKMLEMRNIGFPEDMAPEEAQIIFDSFSEDVAYLVKLLLAEKYPLKGKH